MTSGEKLALNTCPHHHCNPVGAQTEVAMVQWHCHLSLIGQPLGRPASCHTESLHRPLTVETELALELENKYSKMYFEIDQIQNSMDQI